MTSSRTRTLTLVAATSIAALTLSACGGSDSGSGASSSSSSTSSSTSSSSETPSESSTDSSSESSSSSEAPAAEGELVAPKSGLTVTLPEGWEGVDIAKAIEDPSSAPEQLKNAAKGAGTTIDKFLSQYAAVDVMAFGESKDGFAENLNVINIPGQAKMTDATIKQSVEQANKAKVSEIKKLDSPVGEARSAVYTLDQAGKTVQGQMIFIEGPNGTVALTVSTLDAKRTDEIAAEVAKGLKK